MVAYSGLVERVARKFAGLEPFEDLCQVGYIGLLNALSKFDIDAGVRFNTYATYLVAGEIKHYLRDKSSTIRHPAWLQELRHKVTKATATLQFELKRQPTEREIAEFVGVAEAQVREVLATAETLKLMSLDGVPTEEDESEIDKLDASSFCPEQLSVEDRVVLDFALEQLRDLERQVLVLFHFESMNQTEIAAQLDISCNYVSHILRQSLSKLRKILGAEEEKDRLLRRQAEQIDYDVIDAVTGAYTEAYFRSRLREELHRLTGEDASVAIVLLQFRGVQKMQAFYGEHSVMDFLTDAADFLKGNVRRLDVVARLGQSGFGVILPTTGQNVSLVQGRLVQRATDWMHGRFGHNGGIQLEIGYAIAPQDGNNMSELLLLAEPKPVQGKQDKKAA